MWKCTNCKKLMGDDYDVCDECGSDRIYTRTEVKIENKSAKNNESAINNVALLVKAVAFLNLILGIFMGLHYGSVDSRSMDWIIVIKVISYYGYASLGLLIIGEVVQLLEDIKNNLKR